jgi:hypothetical protein
MTVARPAVTANLSAACGAWVDHGGQHAHSHCTGVVALPSPRSVCECGCHRVFQPDANAWNDLARLVERNRLTHNAENGE